MNLAQDAWGQKNIGRLRQLLEDTQDFPDRDFEWFYWQRQCHLEQTILRGHSIGPVAFSPDGERIVTGGDDCPAIVWEAASGKELLTLNGHTSWIRSVASSPDGRRIVTASLDQTARVWHAATGKELLILKA
jgi:WD40 repeat protein